MQRERTRADSRVESRETPASTAPEAKLGYILDFLGFLGCQAGPRKCKMLSRSFVMSQDKHKMAKDGRKMAQGGVELASCG